MAMRNSNTARVMTSGPQLAVPDATAAIALPRLHALVRTFIFEAKLKIAEVGGAGVADREVGCHRRNQRIDLEAQLLLRFGRESWRRLMTMARLPPTPGHPVHSSSQLRTHNWPKASGSNSATVMPLSEDSFRCPLHLDLRQGRLGPAQICHGDGHLPMAACAYPQSIADRVACAGHGD